MNDEDDYRLVKPEDDETEYGIAKPLPPPKPRSKVEPIVNFLGISMREARRNWLVMVLTPFLAAVIECSFLANQIVFYGELNTGIFLVLCIALAIPVGIMQPTSSRALTSGVLNSVFLCFISMLFMISPALFAPTVAPLDEFVLMSMVFMLGYFALSIPFSIIGVYFGHIIREIF